MLNKKFGLKLPAHFYGGVGIVANGTLRQPQKTLTCALDVCGVDTGVGIQKKLGKKVPYPGPTISGRNRTARRKKLRGGR